MSIGEMAYLGLVVGGAIVFLASLAYVTYIAKPKGK
jgi:hypothetical protein